MDNTLPWVAVVDDEASIRRALLRLLRSAGIPALAFDSGASFLAALEAGAPCCAVIDVHMPGGSGLDLLAQLSRCAPAVAVILMTGHHTAGEHSLALQWRPVAYLQKPLSDQLLLAAIGAACPYWRES